jgi:3-methyl-2-oxobutanoate hydroxymethyltransferase
MSSLATPAAPVGRKPVTLHALKEMLARGEKIAVLTCYDSSFAGLLDEAGVDAMLVGDSLGTVLQGRPTTLPVTLDEVAYHTRCVAAARAAAWLIADLPFASYHNADQALHGAAVLMQAGAQMVKLEGGGWTTDIVRMLVERGIPVCAHLGLTPQSVHALGGYRVQGRTESAAALLKRQAQELHEAGAAMLVLELVPAALAAEVSQALPGLLTIGIGAGAQVSGQVLVLHDMLGITRGKVPRFVKNFLTGGDVDALGAVRAYVSEVKQGLFPSAAHST